MIFKDYALTSHAKERIKERSISEEFIKDALQNPTKIMYDEKNRLLIKKLYKKESKDRLLLIVGEIIGNKLKIITIIDTSKIRKYL